MTIEEAGDALEKAADSYLVNVKLNDVEFSVTSADLGLHYDSDCDMKALIKAANNGLKKAASNQNNGNQDNADQDNSNSGNDAQNPDGDNTDNKDDDDAKDTQQPEN